MTLQTTRLVLREFEMDDVASVLAYQSDPRYLRHSEWLSRSEQKVRSFVEMLIGWAAEEPRIRFQFAVTREALLIGTCGVRMVDGGSGEAEYGCELAPAAWGRGYAEEASRALIDFGFQSLGLQRMIANTSRGNSQAIALALRLGFREQTAPNERFEAGTSANSVRLILHAGSWE